MKPPEFPETMSPDGREVWDWAGKMPEYTYNIHKRRELWAEIVKCGTVCGDCDKWMKSRSCPREHNVNGMSRGPSMNDSICPEFVEKQWVSEHRAELKKEYES